MRISDFITQNTEAILEAWEKFARTIEPPALTMDSKGLRDHASRMLATVAADLCHEQSGHEQSEKSKGHGPEIKEETAAETHGAARLLSGFSIEQLVSEYRALRASVLHLWTADAKEVLVSDARDITRFNEAIDQLLAESVRRYSEMVEQSQGMFLAILGHDLRNPLNMTINGSNYLMEARDIAPKYSAIAYRMYKSGKRMNKLVEDLIDFTRTHLGSNLPLAPSPMHMGKIALGVIEELRITHPNRTIELEVDGQLDGVWDENRIAQVFSNLVGNALQHGDQTAPVGVCLYSQEDNVIATVRNAGQPIPPGKLPLIFEPLVRFAESRKGDSMAGESLGLGLYIAREVVVAHKGTIMVSSTTEAGTTFTVKLPKAPRFD